VVVVGALLLAVPAAAQAAVKPAEVGPYNCAGRTEPDECQVQLVGGSFAPFNAAEAPESAVTVTLAGATTAARYRSVIHKIEKDQEAGRAVIVEPAASEHADSELALATVLLTDAGEVFVDESLDPTFGGWYVDPEYTAQGVRKESGGVWARSFSTTWVAVVMPEAASKKVVFPVRVRRVNQQLKSTTWTLAGGEGFVAGCEPVGTEGRADCPGYFGPESEVVPQPLNPWPFL
jgi:hypothetical protein